MSSMSKVLVGGVLALLAVVSVVNTQAIVAISDSVRNNQPKVAVQQPPMMQEYYVGSQTASVLPGVGDEIFYPEPEDPDGGGIWPFVIQTSSTTCEIVWMWDDGTPTGGGSSGTWSNGGCHFNTAASPNSGSGASSSINISTPRGTLSISGSSTTLVYQYKLMVAGYLDLDQLTGKMDTTTQTALRSFQKANGISQSGTFGPLTRTALDAKMAQLKATQVTGTMFSK